MSKTVFITGASKGMGRATAKLFQSKGWNVVATMRKPEIEEELTALENTLVVALDVQDQDSIDTAVAAALEKFGKIDVVVNNAAFGQLGALEAVSMDSIQKIFDVNVFGTLRVSKAIIPHFRENKDGVLINISSVGGKLSNPLNSIYQGTKFAIEGISEGLVYEFATFNGKVKIVEPGAFKTEFGNGSEICTNTELTEYNGLLQSLIAVMGHVIANGSEPELAAEVIYEAATDGTDQLRYSAGEDAKQMLAMRASVDDETYILNVKKSMGLVQADEEGEGDDETAAMQKEFYGKAGEEAQQEGQEKAE